MASTKKKRRRKGIISKLILAVFVIYVSGVLISNQIEVNRLNAEGTTYDEQIATEKMKNARLKELMSTEMSEEDKIREAQNQGYAAPNERVFVDTSGS